MREPRTAWLSLFVSRPTLGGADIEVGRTYSSQSPFPFPAKGFNLDSSRYYSPSVVVWFLTPIMCPEKFPGFLTPPSRHFLIIAPTTIPFSSPSVRIRFSLAPADIACVMRIGASRASGWLVCAMAGWWPAVLHRRGSPRHLAGNVGMR